MTEVDSETRLSFSQKIWRPRSQVTDHYKQLARNCGLSPLFTPIIAYQQLDDEEKVERYFRPLLKHLTDPAQLLDMDLAVARLIQAIEGGEKLAVFGDFDVDGATSSALMVRYFRWLGIPIRVYIPDRLTEGYGPNPQAMKTLQEEGISLVVTVDCGITAFEALAEAKRLGLDVIVTDHHQGRESLPDAVALINPNRLDETFPHKELAGVGVAFYLVMALNRALRTTGFFTSRPEPDLRELLDLVAVGTIVDVASLTGVNRPLVSVGMRVARESKNLGLNALMETARIKGSLSAGQVGFQIGPRINAGGRLGKGPLGSELLHTEDPQRAEQIAAELEEANRERRALEDKMLRQAMAKIELMGLEPSKRTLVLAETGWHSGVIGIIASRLSDRFHRPTVIIALDEEGNGKGSARSIPGIDLLLAIEACGPLLVGFGGHKAAAGLSIEAAQVAAFAEAFEKAVVAENHPSLFRPAMTYDGRLQIPDVNLETVGRLERLQPFGRANPEPVFLIEQVRLMDARAIKESHVKCRLVDLHDNAIDTIAFRVLPGGLGEGLLQQGLWVDVVGSLSINRFRNRETVQLIIRDARPAKGHDLTVNGR
ncbi:MAG: single-stranded-DNA-specific exonuclease RecJ [Magnetococcales bacterium]|nr:single-stranded-DNA-specific exonuclease RecJ [Magnetococcales bacterium]